VRYIKAEEILPEELLRQVQEYVDGSYLYIPRKPENRRAWGQDTQYRQELRQRNACIRHDASHGMGTGLLRKLAHFAEFCTLGACLSCLTGMRLKTLMGSVTLSLACGSAAACVDEALQHLSPGRGPRLTDVGIDTAGVAVGITLLWIGYNIYQKTKNKSGGKQL